MKKSRGYIVLYTKKKLGKLFVNKSIQTQLLDFGISENFIGSFWNIEKIIAIIQDLWIFDYFRKF